MLYHHVFCTLVLLGMTASFMIRHLPPPTLPCWCSAFNQVPRSETPARYDTCKVLITGVVGTDPKEIYMKNGHYVVNFALAVVGHFRALHVLEMYKPTETMWMSMEMWDTVAKENYLDIKKGRPVRGVGYLIHNKWTDKETGEERKMYKMRLTKVLSCEEFNAVSELLGDCDDSRRSASVGTLSDSLFASEAPEFNDQTNDYQLPSHRHASKIDTKQRGTGLSSLSSTSPPTRQDHAMPVRFSQNPRPLKSAHQQQHQSQDEIQPGEPTGPTPQPPLPPPPGAGSAAGRSVWESLKNEYPGMIKPKNV